MHRLSRRFRTAWVVMGIAVTVFGPVRLVAEAPASETGSTPGDASIQAELEDLDREYRQLQERLERIQLAPRIIIDSAGCELRYRAEGEDRIVAPCSAGSGKSLTDEVTGAEWVFRTPHGTFRILSKLRDPMWRRPDWAFVEEGLRPPADPRERFEANVLGDYALGFGDGYFIHGTLYTRLIGENVTHGCVRLDDDPLEMLYQTVPIGTTLLIF